MKTGEIWKVKTSVLNIEIRDGEEWSHLVKIIQIDKDELVWYNIILKDGVSSNNWLTQDIAIHRKKFIKCFEKVYNEGR